MLLSKTLQKRILRSLLIRKFGGGHAEKYDWRKDPNYNPFFTTDFSDLGLENVKLTAPLEVEAKPDKIVLPPADVDISSPYVNFVPEKIFYPQEKGLRLPDFDIIHDVDHEADYGSEDMDFQPDDYKSQHFHKPGWIWPWILVALSLPLYVAFELGYQHYPDHNFFKKPHPLPFSHSETSWSKFDQHFYDDRERYMRFAVDSGAKMPKWKIENGNFVFDRFAGVNQPQQPI